MSDTLSERYNQVAESVININDTVTRIDERLEIFIEKLSKLENKIEHHVETCPTKCAFADLFARTKVLESRNGTALKQEMKEAMKELITEYKIRTSELKDQVSILEKEITSMKLTTQSISHTAEGSAKNWKTVGWFIMNITAPVIYIVIGALLLHWWDIQTP